MYGEVCWSEDCENVDKIDHICLWEGTFWCFKVGNRFNKSKLEIERLKLLRGKNGL